MYRDVLKFWFEEIQPTQRWKKDPAFDLLIFDRFSAVHASANRGELYTWRTTAQGRLAEIIVLDQFSRNMFRDKPESFASDALALVLAQEAIAIGADAELSSEQCAFLYMPYMHSESLIIHELAVPLFEKAGSLEFELKHKHIIEQFGRYPHRNAILRRESTEAELEFMKKNSGF
jgi:uncharacterized protein (DUF924 family)